MKEDKCLSCIEEYCFPMILRVAFPFYTLFINSKTKTLKLPAVILPFGLVYVSNKAKVSSYLFLRTTSHILCHSNQSPLAFIPDPRTNFKKKKKFNSTMNNGSGSKNRWMMGLHLKGGKERNNEDLHLFRELHKRDKERTACLLLPLDDLEHNHDGTN